MKDRAPPPRNVTMKHRNTPQRHSIERNIGRTTRRSVLKYDQDAYDSNNGMLTTIWGPATWHLLHCISFNYPVQPTDTQKQQYRDFVLSLKNVIPCGKCRKNLTKNLAALPLESRHMDSRETFSKYIYDLHEAVNRMLDKTSGLSYDRVRDTYEHFRARCAGSGPTEPQTDQRKTAESKTAKGGRKTKRSSASEKGCVVPFNGKKTKCVLRIVPQSNKCKTFSM